LAEAPRKRRTRRLELIASMEREAASPAVQTVPAETAWRADQAPLAQRWKEVPPTQFQAPSWVQAVP
jgi:hypothetical protein